MSTKKLLTERGTTHGAFSENARLSQAFENIARTGVNWEQLSDVQKEALKLMFHKVARFLSGNVKFLDNPRDIGGYLQLMLNEMQEDSEALDVRGEYFNPNK